MFEGGQPSSFCAAKMQQEGADMRTFVMVPFFIGGAALLVTGLIVHATGNYIDSMMGGGKDAEGE